MSAPIAPAATDAQAQQGGINPMIKSIIRAGAIFFGVQLVVSKIFSKHGGQTTKITDASGTVRTAPVNTGTIPPFVARPDSLDEGAMYNPIPQGLAPMWPVNSLMDIIIVVSPSSNPEPLAAIPRERIVLEENEFRYGDYEEKRVIDTQFSVPSTVQENGTLWGHFHIGLTGSNLDPTIVEEFDPARAFHFVHPLTQYIAQKKVKKSKNLLAGKDETEEPEEDLSAGPTIISHYHPNFTMSFIPDTGVLKYATMHPAMRQYVHPEATGARDGSGQNGWYYPVLFINTFWQLKSHMTTLNSTVTTLPLHIDLNNFSNWKFSIMASIDEGAKQTAKTAAHGGSTPGGGDGSEFEMIKEIILDTNIYLLSTTVVVSILHMGFELLAFKSDISHYRNKKNNVGISVRSILANVFMQGIIFLYLLDNNDNTSWMILFSQVMGIALELWKITTVVDVRIRPSDSFPFGYRIAFEDKHKLSETEERTKEYDEIAFKYMYMIAIPLLLAYAAYSLKYQTHKSWYSFFIATLVGSVYAYGFLMMVPSLYINYRLKSVAHMPARAMMYKFLNTFIDDLFAFTIKMPLLHRLATLRDDVIFFVYLWQSWKYKVDYKRVNEFGQGGDDEQIEDDLTNKPLDSIAAADGDEGIGGEMGRGRVQQEATGRLEALTTGSAAQTGKATKRK